jgi:(3,5-dihydroxyphenyl)acetyl-CoA 1,2-dioxygenase
MFSSPDESLSIAQAALAHTGLARGEIDAWAQSLPVRTSDLAADRTAYGSFWLRSRELRLRIPAKAARNVTEAAAAGAILALERASRTRFLRAHASAVYDTLTAQRASFLRIDELCRRAASAYPGLVPGAQELEAEARAAQRDKDGVEIDHALFLAQVLADSGAGMHLCQAMLLPREDAREHLAELDRNGEIDLGAAHLKRHGKASLLTMQNPRFLNAEDASTLDAMEIAVDLALLDPHTEVCVLRGGMVEHPKHAGKRLFGAGINLTHLYQGKIPFLWYLIRDMGFVNKLYRGLALADGVPDEESLEKPWIAALDGFAIGGHCQTLLAVDYVLAADNAYMTLPARKEGIVPGAANLRLLRFVGDRIARQAIMAGLRIDCASAAGRMICDATVPPADMDAAIGRTIETLTGSGVVSAAGNRRALRAGQEPLDLFRRYMSVYAREQAHCHFSPGLIANLERHWMQSK